MVDRIRRKGHKGEEEEEATGRKKYNKCVMNERRLLQRQLLAEHELKQYFSRCGQRTPWEKSKIVLVKNRASHMLILIQGWTKN